MAQTTNDNSGMGVVLGVILAVLIVVGGFFFLRSEGMVDTSTGTTTAGMQSPDVTINNTEPASGEPMGEAPAPNPAR